MISEFIGGGFGAKQGAGVEALLAAELARAAGRPVRLALSRHEDQVVGGRRAWTRQTVTLGASRDGGTCRRSSSRRSWRWAPVAGCFPSRSPRLALRLRERPARWSSRCRRGLVRRSPSGRPVSSRASRDLDQAMDDCRRSRSTRSSSAGAQLHQPRPGIRTAVLDRGCLALLRPRRRGLRLARRASLGEPTTTNCSRDGIATRISGAEPDRRLAALRVQAQQRLAS